METDDINENHNIIENSDIDTEMSTDKNVKDNKIIEKKKRKVAVKSKKKPIKSTKSKENLSIMFYLFSKHLISF